MTILKFVYSEKATKFCEISTLLLSTVHTGKSKVEISQNFVAFSEYTNFKIVTYGRLSGIIKLNKLVVCSLNIYFLFTVVEEVLRIGVETRRPAFMDVTLGVDQRQILPPRPELPTKPTCSFIR